jgi:hypothetical protein
MPLMGTARPADKAYDKTSLLRHGLALHIWPSNE